MNINIKEWL